MAPVTGLRRGPDETGLVGPASGGANGTTRTPPAAGSRPSSRRSSRLPPRLLGAYLVLALPLLWFVLAPFRWFAAEEWDFLLVRRLTSPTELFRDHQGHWSTLPIIVYRFIYQLFGARTYVPYELTAIVLHLGIVVLLYIVMRRIGVDPWIAAAAAALFTLFGPGEEDIIWGFQIGYTGALALGLGHILLADHDGPIDRRDGIGLALGIGALTCSGVGVAMAAAVAVTTLIRRGWRACVFHAAPLAAMVVVYNLVDRPKDLSPFGQPSVSVVIHWVWSAAIGTFLAVGQYWVLGAILALVLVGGLAVAWASGGLEGFRQHASIPVGLLVGALCTYGLDAQTRWWTGLALARASRYMYIGVALVLPALAVGADALARRWRPLLPVMVMLFLLPIPANARFADPPPFNVAYNRGQQQYWAQLGASPLLSRVPAAGMIDRESFPGVTVGMVRRAAAKGDLPTLIRSSPNVAAVATVRLAISQTDLPAPGRCQTLEAPRQLTLTPRRGTVYGIKSPVSIVLLRNGRPAGFGTSYPPRDGQRLTIEAPDLQLRVTAVAGAASFTVCT